MQPQHWIAMFVGTASNGHKKLFDVDIKQYAAGVVPALQDLRNPQCCPICLTHYLFLILRPSPDSDRCLTELLANEHGFFDACARVLAVPRTIDDLEPLRRQLNRNVARCATQSWHPYLQIHVNDVVYMFVNSLYGFLIAPFRGGPRPLRPGSTFARSRKGIWPTNLDSLFPSGMEAGISAHVFWCHTLITRVAFSFVAVAMNVARPTIWPLLSTDPQRSVLIKAILALLAIGCSNGPFTLADEAGVQPPWVPLADERQAALTVVTSLLSFINDGPDARTGDSSHFFGGYEKAIYDSISMVFDSDITLEPDDHEALLYLGVLIQGRLSLPASSSHPKILAFRDQIYTPEIEQREFATGSRMTCELIMMRRKLRTCSGPGCTIAAATLRPGEPGKLQLCGQCRLMLYCGRACQQADWKDDRNRASHKALCPVLCRLSAVGALDTEKSHREFAEAYDSAGLSQAEFGVLLLWARTSPELITPQIYARFLSLYQRTHA